MPSGREGSSPATRIRFHRFPGVSEANPDSPSMESGFLFSCLYAFFQFSYEETVYKFDDACSACYLFCNNRLAQIQCALLSLMFQTEFIRKGVS